MVVIGIMAALVAVMLPSLARARESARLIQCAGNLHQIVTAMTGYVNAPGSRGRFPPNVGSPGLHWYDNDRIGIYMRSFRATASYAPLGRASGAVFVCPNDGPGPVSFSYAMNVWASSQVDATVLTQSPASARLWSPRVSNPSKMILLAETYSGSGNSSEWYTAPTVGIQAAATPVTSAGQRFGGMGGVNFNARRWNKVTSELCFMRHRVFGTPGVGTESRGRLNIAYADGHVASRTDADLVLPSGRSTGDSYWSPADYAGN